MRSLLPISRSFLHGLIACLAAALLALLFWAQYVFLAGNFHTVVEGQCYRSAQPSAARLHRTITHFDIATIINLRGPNPRAPWYRMQRQVVEQSGCKQVDVTIGSSFAPSEAGVRSLIAALDTSDPPILLHCVSGADRSGLAATFYKLLKTEADLDTACDELSVCFGHNPFGSARCLGCVLDDYRRWLHERNLPHARHYFLDWANHGYNRELILHRYQLPREPNEK